MARLTVVSFGGSYQEGQSKALFQPAAKALGITVKEETYTGIADLRLKVKAGAVTWDVVDQRLRQRGTRRLGGHPREAGLQNHRHLDFLPGHGRGVFRRRRRVLDGARMEHEDIRRQWSAELGRLLGREEVSGQAGVSQRAWPVRSSRR